MDFEEIYIKYFQDVYLYIRKMSNSENIAEEVTSDTFFKAMKSIDSFRGDCDIRIWLCQIAKNSYYSFLKKEKRRGRTYSIDSIDGELSVEHPFFEQYSLERVQKLLHQISEPYKEVFMWRVYANLSFKQIGKIFGKSENWACVTYHRARNKIKEKMEVNYNEE